ncbi:MAG TPA: amidase family protein [Nitrospiraceae bacterium]|nr:amidase family protein [Nitrospiraceae bacterium]
MVEASIPEMQRAMEQGRVTSQELVRQYIARIEKYDSQLHATITVNRNALREAQELDRERAAGKVRGPLHGIPIALKDIIHTTNLTTTGGAMAFRNVTPSYDATLTRNLRDAGAVIIAKTSLTELANWVAGAPTPMPTNYNAIAGQGINPYDSLLPAGGSSSGIGTAVNFWAANVGTETSGSILNPASRVMLAAVKPTVGRISRYGVIPITADQDTPGPMAKTVTDAAILLGALESASPDPNDPATRMCTAPPNRDYTRFLNANGLRGARIGVPRAYFYNPIILPGRPIAIGGGLTEIQMKIMTEAIGVLRQQGATIVDPADVPSVVEENPTYNFATWNICSGVDNGRRDDTKCSIVLKYGMKRDFNRWLATLGSAAPVKSLNELRLWNLEHEKDGAIKFGQSNLDISDEMDVAADKARYEGDRAKDIELAATHGIDEVMKAYKLDALLFPGPRGADIAARPGYPTVIVPFTRSGDTTPFGVSFTGMACTEPRLLELGYAFEQATKRRVPPPSYP